MSYYSSPDPQKLRNHGFAQTAPFYVQTPPTPTHSQPSPSRHALPSSTPGHAYGADSHSMTWSTSEPSGLGLIPMPMPTSRVEAYPATSSESMSMSLNWPSEFTTSGAPGASFETMRKDSWTGSCDPMSTLLPSAPVWEPHNMPLTEFHPSPGRSEYSNSTQASCMSSPYANSDAYLRPTASPMVKLEDQPEYASQRLHYIPESTPFDQSMIVNPGDLVTRAPSMPYRSAMSSVVPSSIADFDEEMDVKPFISSGRPPHRRAFSSEDYKEGILDDRPKRGFTSRETASCACVQCGKLFQRSYNLKAHMETHDPHRNHPHVCDYIDCDKRFVRRTDLVRHEQSVRVPFSSTSISDSELTLPRFISRSATIRARYVTALSRAKIRSEGKQLRNSPSRDEFMLIVRRHIDDGCPKRPEVRKRMSKSRRSSATSMARRSSFQMYQDRSPTASPLRRPVHYA